MNQWRTGRPRTQRGAWRWVRLGGGALITAVLVMRLGATPFVEGVRRVDAAAVAAAICITAVTTVVSAWRWRLIARGLDLEIPLNRAVTSYYRSQFLNNTLPGGIVGDLHRGLRHGEEACDVSRGLRSVVWDRTVGQIVQIILAAATLLALTSPVRPAMAVIVGVSAGSLTIIGIVVLAMPERGPSWLSRLAGSVRKDVRAGLLTWRAWPAIFIASALVVAGHVGVFLVAARADGSPASIRQLVPLAMLVLLSMTIPTSIGGWGPREGVAAWAFAVAGLGANAGVETATTYGVLSLVATLPGAVGLVVSHWPLRSPRTAAVRDETSRDELVGSASGSGSGSASVGRGHG